MARLEKKGSGDNNDPVVIKAREHLNKIKSAVDKADQEWVDAYYKNGGKEDKIATTKLNRLISTERGAIVEMGKAKASRAMASSIMFLDDLFNSHRL